MVDRRIVGVEDLVLISKVTDDGIMQNLQTRFSSDEIYTYLGNVLIVCNPFKWLPLYDVGYVKKFNNGILAELEPHIYAIAEKAFKEMILEDFNQCVIISGESGAGKTEAAKQIMNYIAAVSGSGGNDSQVNKVKNIILDSNPALESFGNAMTLRNNNSSRFGKYFEINFSANGTPMGGKITNFLLERGRLVHLGPGERSFHIFYQLVFSPQSEVKRALGLSNNPNDYKLLGMSGVTTVNNEGGSRNDAQDLQETMASLETVNILEKGQFHLFMIAASVLHLGNIDFRDKKINGAEGCELGSRKAQEAVQTVAQVLQIDSNEFLHNLTYRTLITMAPGKGFETYQVPQNAVQASATRDSVCKDLYARMFDLLVNKVNESLKAGGQKTRASVRRQMRQSMMNDFSQGSLSIGVLDIYGFEIFDENFFEQFCINYVNEKLQQVFIELTIRAEQEDYEAEGIAWVKIPFFDNKVVCELIEGAIRPEGAAPAKKKFGKKFGGGGKAGIFAILDDTAKTVTAMESSKADRRFQDSILGVHSSHKHLKNSPNGFQIIHYAGTVKYNVEGFVDANRDTLSKELILMMQKSGRKFIQLLYPEQVDYNDKTMPPSTGFKVKSQANDLIGRLKQCEPHYVRCIKSNHRKAPRVFEREMVLHQVTYLNLLENVKIRRAGFAYRVKFLDFNRRFKVLGLGVVDTQFYARARPEEITMQYMTVAAQRLPVLNQQGEVQFGKTKLFIKTPEILFELQKLRRTMLGEVATKIQRFYKFFKAQKKLFDMKTHMISVFERVGKPTTPVDVLGNYQAFYIDDTFNKQWIDDILGYYRDQQMVQEKIMYTDVVDRIGGFLEQEPEKVIFVLTDQAFYIMRWEQETMVKKTAMDKLKFFSKKRHTVVPKTDEYGNAARKLQLKKRVALTDVTDLLLTTLPDDLLKIGVQTTQPLMKPDKSNFVDSSKVKRCMQSQEPFSFFGKSKNRCHFTGGVFVKELMTTACVPDKGFYEPVPVLAMVANKINTEMQEDVIIQSEHKAEIASLLMELVTKLRTGGGFEQALSGGMGGMGGMGQYGNTFAQMPQMNMNIGNSGPLEPSFSNNWNVNAAQALFFSPGGMLNFGLQANIGRVMFQPSLDGGPTMGLVPANGISADRQRRLKEFLYKREERKQMKNRNKQAINEQARQNQLRFAQEDKELRARQRAERKAKRAQGYNGGGQAAAAGNNNAWQANGGQTASKPSNTWNANRNGSSNAVSKPANAWNANRNGSSNAVSKPANAWNANRNGSSNAVSKAANAWNANRNENSNAVSKPANAWNANRNGSSNAVSKPANAWNANRNGSSNAVSKPANAWGSSRTASGNVPPGLGEMVGKQASSKFSNNAGGGSSNGFSANPFGNPVSDPSKGYNKPQPAATGNAGWGNNNGNGGGAWNNNSNGGGYAAQSAPAPAPAQSGDDWERVFDPNTGRHYFYNYKTQESVWDES